MPVLAAMGKVAAPANGPHLAPGPGQFKTWMGFKSWPSAEGCLLLMTLGLTCLSLLVCSVCLKRNSDMMLKACYAK